MRNVVSFSVFFVVLAIADVFGSSYGLSSARVYAHDASPMANGSTGLAILDQAIQEQADGDDDAAIGSYTQAGKLLNQVVVQPMSQTDAKVVRDRLAFSVMQIALLERGKTDTDRYLNYVYSIERIYLGPELSQADRLFAAGSYKDAFTIYRVFATRSGDDKRSGRQRSIFVALDAASNGKFEHAENSLKQALGETGQFGNSEVYYLLGETERALRRQSDGDARLWAALSANESEHLKFGLLGSQVCAARALTRHQR